MRFALVTVAVAIPHVGVVTLVGPAQAADGASVLTDGVDDFVTMGRATGLGASSFTVEAWFHRTGPGIATNTSGTTGGGLRDVVPLVTKGRGESDGSNVDLNYFVGLSADGRLAADLEEGATGSTPGLNHAVTGATVVPDGWHHAAATYDGTWRLYLDGRLDASVVVGQPPRADSIQHFAVGSALSSTGVPSGAFAGQVDEVRVWDRARTGSEIAGSRDVHLDSGTNLLGSWRMDDGAGSTAADSSGNGWTGSLRNGATWSSGFEPPPPSTGPGAPTGVTATGGAGSVDVSWEPVSGAVGYQVFRETRTPVPTTGTPVSGVAPVLSTTFTDRAVAAGVPYAYVVRSIAGSGQPSPPSAAAVAQSAMAAGQDPVVLAAGDIAACTTTGDDATAAVLDGADGTVQTIGDNVYPDGTAADFADCYDPGWGRHRWRTRPAIGNHEYHVTAAAPYWDYFGTLGAGLRSQGWYSYDIGSWHVVVLNTECGQIGGCGSGSPADTWLRQDLAASAGRDVLAVMHRSRFSSATNGADPAADAYWRVLYQYGADVVLGGHRHVYERFAPQNPDGVADPAYGIRQFTVGTGGSTLGGLGTTAANSQARSNNTYGVLRLTLRPGAYDWSFLPASGGAGFTDSGSGVTHAPPPVNRAPVVDTVGVAPSAPGTADVLTASVGARDPDGDALSYSYTWRTDGVVRRTATTTSSTDAFDLSGAGNGDPGQVVSVDVVVSDGRLSSGPASTSVTVTAPLVAPADLTATARTTAVRLTWTSSPGTAGHHVYRATGGGPWLRLTAAPVTTPSYDDREPVVGALAYRVTAVDGTGRESQPAEVPARRLIAAVGSSTAAKASVRKLVVPTPAGVAAGDVLVAAVSASGSVAPTPGAGWTLVRTEAGGTALRTSVWTRVVLAAEPLSHSWSVPSNQSLVAAVTAYRGADVAQPVSASSGTATSGASLTAPSASSPVADGVLVGVWAVAARASFTPPPDMWEQADLVAWSTNKPAAALEVADQLLGSVSATGTRTATASAGGAGTAQLVVLNPVPR